jgi:diadenosine tetraphosphatase ApaH/serine/threonine PP2A family protein phosphatase
MRYLVLTDIHGNIDALDAVLADAGDVDAHLLLGDVVGYGAGPNEVIARVRGLAPAAMIRGNHDKVIAGLEIPESFNPAALQSAAWTAETLTPDHREWLAGLPQGPAIVDDVVEICHGMPHDEDEYLFTPRDASRAMDAARRPVCLFGHTHVPACYIQSLDDPDLLLVEDTGQGRPVVLPLDERRRFVVNPGAVGQPRDGDPRAAYAIYDSEARTLALARIEYDVELAQRRIRDAGLPDILARRLAVGR